MAPVARVTGPAAETVMLDFVLAAKLGIALACIAATLLVLRAPGLESLEASKFDRLAFLLLAVCRLGLFVLVLIILRIPAQSDVTVYYEEARQALAGGVPLKDFFTAYSPLFPYLAALPLHLWDSAKAIMLVGMLLELVALPLWLNFARSAFDERTVRRATIVYCLNPFAQLTIPLAGQNHVWLAFFLALGLSLTAARRRFDGLVSGAGFALATVFVKWLALLYAPVLFLHSRRRLAWLLGLVLPIALLYGAWSGLYGADTVLGNLRFHAGHHSSGNLPYLLTFVGLDLADPDTSRWLGVAGLAVLATVFLIPAIRLGHFDERAAACMLVVVTLAFLIVSKKAFSSYLVITLFPFCLVVAESRRTPLAFLTVLAFLGLVGMEPSLWFRWLGSENLDLIRMPAFASHRIRGIAFLAVEVLVLDGYAALLAESLRLALSAGRHLPRPGPTVTTGTTPR
jgi:hypothetical protein